MSEALKQVGRAIFQDAMQAVDVGEAVRSKIILQNSTLTLAGTAIRLAEIDRVVILAIGKAAVPMYRAAANALAGVALRAAVVAPIETLPATGAAAICIDETSSAVFLPGAHPIPDVQSFRAADAVLETLAGVTDRTVVLFLVSGGASAMVERPLNPQISLHDLVVFSRALVGSGLDITAMNALRKHLSAVKGGRLAQAASKAMAQCTLLISDVPAASPDAIGSGPSLPDSTTALQTKRIFDQLRAVAALPKSIMEWFEQSLLPETPKADDPAFSRASWEVILSSDHLECAAVQAAERAGFRAVVDNTCDEWEYRDAALYLLERSQLLSNESQQPVCLISVGEIGVTIGAQHGQGGRNQQFALWCAHALSERQQRATVLSAGTDGIDGHSNAAGAVCDEQTVERARTLGLSVPTALANFNASPLLDALGESIITGPTGNNLRDLRVILSAPDA